MNSIGTGEFIKQISEETGYTQVQIKDILNAAGKQIKTNLQNNTEMHFIGYFNIGVKEKAAATKLNPFTGKKIKVEASKVPTVKLSATFKKMLKK